MQDKTTNLDEQSPLDDLISRVESYIKDPALVSRETLTEMKSELENLKSYMDTEETQEGNPTENGSNGGHKPGLTIVIGHAMGGKKA